MSTQRIRFPTQPYEFVTYYFGHLLRSLLSYCYSSYSSMKKGLPRWPWRQVVTRYSTHRVVGVSRTMHSEVLLPSSIPTALTLCCAVLWCVLFSEFTEFIAHIQRHVFINIIMSYHPRPKGRNVLYRLSLIFPSY